MPDLDLPDVPPAGAPTEPLISVAAVTAFVVSAIACGVAFGLPISDDQQVATLGVIAPAAVIVTAVWSRRRVFSPASVRALVVEARTRRASRTSMPYTTGGIVSPPETE